MAALAHVLLAVLAVALALVSMRRADRAEAQAARCRENAVLAVEAMRRLRGDLTSLAGRAAEIERSVAALNRRDVEARGDVSEAGALLACAVLHLRVDVDEVRDGSDGQ